MQPASPQPDQAQTGRAVPVRAMVATNHVRGALVRLIPVGAFVVVLTLTVLMSSLPSDAAPADGQPEETIPVEDPTDGTSVEPTPAEGAGDGEDEALSEQLREGQQVYSQICSSCHQPGGAGLPGQYPPLLDNPSVDDEAYVRDVIENGRRGQLVVAGETYDGVMPSFSTLTDDETEAVIAYLQAGFVAPAAVGGVEPTGPVAGAELPPLANMGAIVAYLLAAAVAAMVLAPRLVSENSRLNTPWFDAWLKTGVIVTAVILFTVVLPDWALKQGSVAKLSRFAQDFIGTGLWAGGLAALLFGLWYAHRESRI